MTNLRNLPCCTSTYEAGLQEAAALQQQSVKQSTVKARISVARELMDWLQSMHRSMVTAIPEDIPAKFCSSPSTGYQTMLALLPPQEDLLLPPTG